LFYQFKTEVLKHVTKEDLVVFPVILKYERIYTDKLINLSDNFEVINSLVNDIVMKNQH
jgi:iron-sulfur cluster repair protein YtfE (RIC family)